MVMDYFVKEDSVVRVIWGKPDTVLFIFAAASAEFALNKAVDWLFFTGKLPADPLGRLFSTVTYAREIVFSSTQRSYQVIDRMALIHQDVENKRGYNIPDWAYRDVLFMLIDYSIRSYELLNAPLNLKEKEEVYDVFRRVGQRMGVKALPGDFKAWLVSREKHLIQDLQKTEFTEKLFVQYRKHLGWARFKILVLAQTLVLPDYVRKLLGFKYFNISKLLVSSYKLMIRMNVDWYIKRLILPSEYINQVRALEVNTKH
jgi:uncharacterized protein (DUF2236 family)